MIQEIDRAYDQPATVAEYLIDRAAFGEHPLGRTVLGPEENLRSFTREGIVAFRERRWSGARGGAFLVGNTDHLPDEAQLHECFGRFPGAARARAVRARRRTFRPQTLVEERETNQSHLRMIYRPDDRRRRPCASAPRCRSTRRCSAARWARGCSTRSARSAASATRSTRSTTPSPTCRSCSSARASTRPSAIEAYTRMREIVDELRERRAHARRRSSGRAPTPPDASCWRSRTPAPSPATPPTSAIVYGEEIDPDAAIAALDAVTFDEVREVARGVAEELAVACVGPHSADEF